LCIPILLQLLPIYLFLGLGHTAMNGSRVLVSLYALHLQSSVLTVGILVSLFALFPALFAVLLGRWVDRLGTYWPMLCGALCVALGLFLPFAFPQIELLFLAAVLIGTGHVMIQVSGQHAVGALSTAQNRTGNFSMLAITYSVSSLSGPLIVGFMIDSAGFRATFLLLFGLIFIGLLLHLTHQVKLPPAFVHTSPVHQSSALGLLLNPRVRDIYLIGFLHAAAWDLYTFVLPIHGTQLGFSASTIGVILSSFAGATLAVRLVMPLISRHFKEWQILRFATVWLVLAYLALPFIGSFTGFMMFSFMLGLALGCGQPNLLSLLHVGAPPGRGAEALGLRLTVGNGTQTALPLFFGAAGAALGMMTLFWGMAAIIGFGVPVAHRQVKALTRKTE